MGNNCGIATDLQLKEQVRCAYHIKDLARQPNSRQPQGQKSCQREENFKNYHQNIAIPPCKLLNKTQVKSKKSSDPSYTNILDIYKINPAIIGTILLS